MLFENDFSGWTGLLSEDLQWILGKVFPSNESAFSVEICMPGQDAAEEAFKKNKVLRGSVAIAWNGSQEKITLKFPFPFKSVFFFRNGKGDEALPYIWVPCLGEKPGFRILKKYSEPQKDNRFWRLGLLHGNYIEGVCGKPYSRKNYSGTRFFARPEYYPEEIGRMITTGAPFSEALVGAGTRVIVQKWIASCITEYSAKSTQDTIPSQRDYDDITEKTLVTFPLWLRGSICSRIVEEILSHDRDVKKIERVFSGTESSESDLQGEIWERLVKSSPSISNRIVPFRTLLASGRITYISPENPADMVSLLTGFMRASYKTDVVKRLPFIYRQNHPTFKGIICPVQSPESEKVGISLHVTRKAYNGLKEAEPDDELGFGANLIPFYHHNDGARDMMGSKNLRQAVLIEGRKSPLITTGGEEEVLKITRPFIEIGLCPDARDEHGRLALGRDMLVAYLPWKGMNTDDAIVVGEHVVKSGVFNIEKTKTYTHEIRSGWNLAPLRDNPVISFRGLAEKGARVLPGVLIASFTMESSGNPLISEVRYSEKIPGVLKDISFKRAAPWKSGILTYTIERKFALGIGDKLMGRHGNKGVIGAIIPEKEMPRLPDDDSIPQAFRGRPVDMILNPHGIISRMNIGQLMETHLGWLLGSGVHIWELLQNGQDETHIGRAFFNGLDHEKVKSLLEKSGLDRYGRTRLELPDGGQTKSPVVVGLQHIVRLAHIPEVKVQARHGGLNALYSAATGQAAHGRSRGGGQRFGEMEVWALSAHGADAIIQEMLGVKSDVVLVNALKRGDLRDDMDKSSFLSRFRDFLFAVNINLEREDGALKFSCLKEEEVRRRGKRVDALQDDFVRKILTSFHCTKGGKKGCEGKLLDGEKIAVSPPGRISGKGITIRLDDLLEHVGYKRQGPIKEQADGTFMQRLCRDEIPDGALMIMFENTNDQIKGVLWPSDANRPSFWPAKVDEVFLYGRFAKEGGGNFRSDELMTHFESGNEDLYGIGDLRLSCQDHRTSPLQGRQPFSEVLNFRRNGIYDPVIFGDIRSACIQKQSRWGYIELPVEIPYPSSAFSRRFVAPEGATIKSLPVLPLRYRLPVRSEDGFVESELVTRYYRPILTYCSLYQRAEDEKAKDNYAKTIEERVTMLFKTIVKMLNGKDGLIRGDGLGRRVDRSARMVVVPDPALDMDQAGIPVQVLVELLGEELLEWAKEQGRYGEIADRLISALGVPSWDGVESNLDFNAATALLREWDWSQAISSTALVNLFRELLTGFLESRKVVVLLNRQPSLHRESIQAFFPVPVDDGYVLRISPLVCKGFNADFDGDEMTVHLPISEKAREEAMELLPSRNMRSVATGLPAIHYDQDFVLGTYWLGHDFSGMRDEFLRLFDGECCKELIGNAGMEKKDGSALLEHLIAVHKDEAPRLIRNWMELAHKCCTAMGVSYGFYELMALHEKIGASAAGRIRTFADKGEAADLDSCNKKLQNAAVRELESVVSSPVSDTPGLHFGAMALSGARGLKQVRQIIAARGYLAPGETPFKEAPGRFFFGTSLVEGMSPEDAFYAAMNARKTICDKKLVTPVAGYLMRRLVFALWPYKIIEDDCCADNGGIITCKSKRGFCAKCYGPRTDSGVPPSIGFPAGLIAAQSIGERGTQLAMRSYHTGTSEIDLEYVKAVLKEQANFQDGTCEDFVSLLKRSDAYKDIDERHFQVLWRVIHDSDERTLASAISKISPLSAIAFESQAERLLLAMHSASDPVTDPVARVLCNSLEDSAGCEEKEIEYAKS